MAALYRSKLFINIRQVAKSSIASIIAHIAGLQQPSKFVFCRKKMSKFRLPVLGEEDNNTESPTFQAGSLFKSHKNSPEKSALSQTTNRQATSPSGHTAAQYTSKLQTQATSQPPTESSKVHTPTAGCSTSTLAEDDTSRTENADAISDPPVPRAGLSGKTNNLIVSRRQRGNPILKHVRNVPYEFGEIIPDYQLGQTSCALFLSLRYHALHPTYVHERIKQLGYSYDLRVLLVQVDVKDPHHSLKELARLCLFTDCTLILAWSAEEAGTYLETFKAFESKPPDLIMERMDTNFYARMIDVLTTVKKVNKTDAATLISNFETMEHVVNVDEEELGLCSGFGPQKAKRLLNVFQEPFLKSKKKKKESDKSTKDGSGKTTAQEKR